MEPERRQRGFDWASAIWPSDRAHFVFLLGTAILAIIFRKPVPRAWDWCWVNLALVGCLVLLCRIWPDPRRGAIPRMAFTMVVIPVVFTQLGWLVPFVNPHGKEELLFHIDRAMFFGVNPVEATARLANPVLTEVLQWVYDFYFFIAVMLGSAVLRTKEPKLLARITHAFIVCVYASYVGYYLLPAKGPNINHLGLYNFATDLPGVFMARELRETLFMIEKIKQDCFPSGHTAVSVLALLLAYRYVPRLVKPLWPLVAALVFSTVYLRYHYVADVLGGILLALVADRWARRSHLKFEERHWKNHGEPSGAN
ncbi:MAG TPA: inositol phosphorylceramide synthase [Planctomycetes bacterium]|nr:inositol phosphorylceramide synthase [Planctomycetota bacterium]